MLTFLKSGCCSCLFLCIHYLSTGVTNATAQLGCKTKFYRGWLAGLSMEHISVARGNIALFVDLFAAAFTSQWFNICKLVEFICNRHWQLTPPDRGCDMYMFIVLSNIVALLWWPSFEFLVNKGICRVLCYGRKLVPDFI